MKSPQVCSLVAGLALLASTALAQITLTGPTTYTQDFDTLPSSGSTAWVDDSTVPGWFHQRSGVAGNLMTSTGTSTTGGIYSYGSFESSERALGTQNTAGVGNLSFRVVFHNTSGQTLTVTDLSYYGEMWRKSNSSFSHSIEVWYAIAASNPSPLDDVANPTGFTQLPAAAYFSPVLDLPATSLDGNAYRTPITAALNLEILNNYYFILHFSDRDELSHTDHGLAIDDFAVTFAIPEPSTYAASFGALALTGVIAHRRRKQTQT